MRARVTKHKCLVLVIGLALLGGAIGMVEAEECEIEKVCKLVGQAKNRMKATDKDKGKPAQEKEAMADDPEPITEGKKPVTEEEERGQIKKVCKLPPEVSSCPIAKVIELCWNRSRADAIKTCQKK